MMAISVAEARRLDRQAQDFYGIPISCLMEAAGCLTAQVILDKFQDKRKIVLFCGKGNNAGDGFVCGRYLINAGREVEIFLLVRRDSIREEPARNLNILEKMQTRIFEINSAADLNTDFINSCDLIIDAIFGVGLMQEVAGIYKEAIDFINKSHKIVLSVDVPSGLNADTGKILGCCVKADTTVTFVSAKKGFFIEDGPSHCGDIVVKDIGIPILNEIVNLK